MKTKIMAGMANTDELTRLMPLCDRSSRAAVRRGWLPSIRLPGKRCVMFHWESVPAAELKMQLNAD